MKTKLLFNNILALAAIVCLSLAPFSVRAQTSISFNAAPPTSGEAGATIPVGLLYKLNAGTNASNPGGTISLQLNLVDPAVLDTWGNPTETAMTGAMYATSVAVAATETAYPTTVTLGSSATTLSANLTGGKYYVLRTAIFEHNTGNDWDWKDSKSTPFTLTAASVVTYSNTFSNNTVQSKAEGTIVTESVQYTTPDLSKIVFKLQKLRSWPSAWQETDIPGTTVTFENLAATASGTTRTQAYSITIPAGTLANYPLGTDESYKVVAILTDMTGNHWTDVRKTLLITSSLGTTSFNKQASKLVTQNPAKETLVLNNEIDFKSVSIFDLSGKLVLKTSKEKTTNGVDISNLAKGVYLIVTDNNLKTKFIKE